MTDWTHVFDTCTSDELDKLALLRIIECSNGIIQYMYRDDHPDALTLEETREAMGFSMSSIKRMKIVLENEIIEFSDDTKKIMSDVRTLYVSGMKRNNDEDYAEFLVASLACLEACGIERLQAAKDKLFAHCYSMPPYAWDFGLDYCKNFLKEGLIT
tara:strand:+ start:498 stop:968 length:471 start_codon:yes stop_codon:yes gene_type:complete